LSTIWNRDCNTLPIRSPAWRTQKWRVASRSCSFIFWRRRNYFHPEKCLFSSGIVLPGPGLSPQTDTRGVSVRFYRKLWRVRIHMSGQRRKLTSIPRIFEQHHIVWAQANGTHVSVFIKYVSCQVQNDDISVMWPFGEQVCEGIIRLGYEIVNDQENASRSVELCGVG